MPDVSLNGIEFVIKGSSDEASESVDKLTDKLNDLKSSLMGVREVSRFSVAIQNIGNAARSASKPMNNFLASIKRIAFYRMIRTIIKEISDAIREGAENFYNFSKSLGSKMGTFAAAMDKTKLAASQMKNQIGVYFAELYQLVVPIILDLINYVSQLAEFFSKLFAALRGAEGWWKANASGISDVGGAAKEALKYLAPFDELNRLPSDNGGGGGGGGSTTYEWMPFGDDSGWGKIAQFVRENLEALELLVDIFGFTIGVVALLSGHIALGLGMMLYFGYKGVQNINENWDTIKEQLQGSLGGITAIVSGALLALGAILTFTGANIPLGIGMMLAGAMGLAAVVAANWDEIPDKLRGPLGEATAIISGASLVLGILMLLCGAWPVGLGLILAGAAGLTATAVANWDNIKEIGKQFIDKVKAGIDEGISDIKSWVKTHITDPITAAVGNAKTFVVTIGVKLKEGATTTINNFKTKLNTIKDKTATITANLKGTAQAKFDALAAKWTELKTKTVTMTASLVNNVKDSVISKLADAWEKIKSVKAELTATLKTSNALQSFMTAWNNLKNLNLEIKATLVDSIKNAWNKMANAWNGNSLLKALYTMPVLAAKGGIFSSGQLIIARESGPEIVGKFGNRTGVMNNEQIVRAVSEGVARSVAAIQFSVAPSTQSTYVNNEANEETMYRAMLRALNSADRQPIEIDIDGEPVYRGVVNRNRKETFRTGVNPLMSRA